LKEKAIKYFEKLSNRENDVFQYVVRGCTNSETAELLGLSPRTVEKHRLSLQKKFSVKSQALLVRYAMAMGVGFDNLK